MPSEVAVLARYKSWIGTGSYIFYYGIFAKIWEVNLSCIVGITGKIHYDCDGQAVWSSKHGGTGRLITNGVNQVEIEILIMLDNWQMHFQQIKILFLCLYLCLSGGVSELLSRKLVMSILPIKQKLAVLRGIWEKFSLC